MYCMGGRWSIPLSGSLQDFSGQRVELEWSSDDSKTSFTRTFVWKKKSSLEDGSFLPSLFKKGWRLSEECPSGGKSRLWSWAGDRVPGQGRFAKSDGPIQGGGHEMDRVGSISHLVA